MKSVLMSVLAKRLEFSKAMIVWHRKQIVWYAEMLKSEKKSLARVEKECKEIVKNIEKEKA